MNGLRTDRDERGWLGPQASGHAMGVVTSVLERAVGEGVINTEQHKALATEIARLLPS